MKILKFGGSSVSTSEKIIHVGTLIKNRLEGGDLLSVVFSAFGGVTDQLILAATTASKGSAEYLDHFKALKDRHVVCIDSLLSGSLRSQVVADVLDNFSVLEDLLKGVYLVQEASPRTLDYILSFGERNSAYIIAAYLSQKGVPTNYLDARLIIKTNKDFGQAKVHFDRTNEAISRYFKKHTGLVHIVTGFIASDIGGLTTTLGRGGSDYTASIIAGALNAESLEIWTDVDGVLTSNPKIVSNAYTIPNLTYDEAMELSHFGAKVIYPPTIQPALARNVPISIRNTFNPDFAGTLISRDVIKVGKGKITGVTSISKITLLTLEGAGLVGNPGIAARFFNCLGREKINIIMITQASSEHSICLAVSSHEADRAAKKISQEFESEINSDFIKPVKAEVGLSLVAVIGEKMKHVPGVAGSLFKALGHNGINVVAIAQGSSELNITFAIKEEDERKALNLVHDVFFLSPNKRIHVYLMGVGLIGSTLLQQIKNQRDILLDEKQLDICVIGLSNSKNMLFDRQGIDLNQWGSLLSEKGEKTDFDLFVRRMREYNLPNAVFVDCTASNEIKNIYPSILRNNVSISTANKVAASSSYSDFTRLKKLALQNNVQFMFETNVAAGLPVLSTLSSLVESGDHVTSIKAVISGSLSFIFNNYSPDKSFKELILEARRLGYTEPDPRDDLSGLDIKRKIVILCRVAGYAVEPEQVNIQPLLPSSCIEAATIDEFFIELDKHDSHFRAMIEEAHRTGSKLRYMATFEDGKASILLKKVTSESPFFNLASTDNMIVFETLRYKERPMIIQGPGAGADVTAAGVFSEIIQLGNAAL